MAWIVYEGLEYETDRVSKAGKKYDCYVMKGTKKLYPDGEEPYAKVFFDNSSTTIIEKGVARPNISVVQFLQKGCNPGDLLVIKNVRRGGKWELESIENRTTNRGGGTVNDYEPLSKEELNDMQNKMMGYESDPTRPAAPTTPQMAPINYNPATA